MTGSYDGVGRVWNTDGELLLNTAQCAGHNGQPIKCVTWIADGMCRHPVIIANSDVLFCSFIM